MASTLATSALLVCLNLLFFTLVSSTYVPCPPPPPKACPPPPSPPKACPPPPPKAYPPPPAPKAYPPPPPKANPPPPVKVPSPPTTPCPPPPYQQTPSTASCPRDALKLGVCANVLNGLINIIVGGPPKTPCCSLISGLADLKAAACLCTALKANVLGINLNVPISLSLLLNYCGKNVPSGFQCA